MGASVWEHVCPCVGACGSACVDSCVARVWGCMCGACVSVCMRVCVPVCGSVCLRWLVFVGVGAHLGACVWVRVPFMCVCVRI